jgi:hypothetical protein
VVKDPGTGKTYYTEKINKEGNGAVTLTDAKTKSTVTIQNSEVTEVSEQTYQQGLAAAAAPPALRLRLLHPRPAPGPAATGPATAPAATPPPAPAR